MITKQPREVTTFVVVTSNLRELQQGEVIDSAEVESIEVTTGVVSTLDIIDLVTVVSPNIYIRVSGGNSGEVHKITILATTDQSHVRELEVLLQIREL